MAGGNGSVAVRSAWLLGMRGAEDRGVEWCVRGEAVEVGSECVVATGEYSTGAAEGLW